MRRAAVGLVAAFSLLLVSSGCGVDKLAEKATEEGVEKAIEKAAEGSGGGDVDIDIDEDGGKVTYEGEDGSMTMGGGEVPDSFPEDVPLPDDYTVIQAMEVTGADGFVQLVVHTAGTVEELGDSMEQGLTDGGYTIDGTQKQTVGGASSVLLSAAGAGQSLMVTVAEITTEGEVSIAYHISAEEA